jgi:hypothetical protein
MKGKLTALIVLGVLVAVSAEVFAEDHPVGTKTATVFSVVYLDDVEPRSEKARIKSIATKARVAAIQGEITSDPVLVRKLKARGIPIRHIIGRQRAFNGSVVFYLR